MLPFPDFVKDGRVSDGVGYGTIMLAGGVQVAAEFDTDEEEMQGAVSLDAVFENAGAFLTYFQPPMQQALQAQIATEITDAAYEQTPEGVPEGAQKKLQDDLRIHQIRFFTDAVVLIYRSPGIFEENDIIVQLMDDFTVDEIYADV